MCEVDISIKATGYLQQISLLKTFKVQWPLAGDQLINVVNLSKVETSAFIPHDVASVVSMPSTSFLKRVQVLLGPIQSLISVEINSDSLIYHAGSLFSTHVL